MRWLGGWPCCSLPVGFSRLACLPLLQMDTQMLMLEHRHCPLAPVQARRGGAVCRRAQACGAGSRHRRRICAGPQDCHGRRCVNACWPAAAGWHVPCRPVTYTATRPDTPAAQAAQPVGTNQHAAGWVRMLEKEVDLHVRLQVEKRSRLLLNEWKGELAERPG